MLSFTNGKDKITVKKQDVKILLSGSTISHLTETIRDAEDTMCNFNSVLDMAGISTTTENSKHHWNIFIEFLRGKTVFHTSPIISDYTDAINVILRDCDVSDVIDRLKVDVIPKSIPEIIKGLNLEKMYTQLIFYEYVYMSNAVTLYEKLKAFIDYEYVELLTLIDRGILQICTDSENDIDIDGLEIPVQSKINRLWALYHWYPNKIEMIKTFVDNHSEWMDCNLNICKSTTAVRLVEIINDKDELRKIVDSNRITTLDLCCLNIMYENNKNCIQDAMTIILPKVDYTDLYFVIDSINTEVRQTLYRNSLDLIIKLMEDNHTSIKSIPKSRRSKILALWFKIDRATYKTSGHRRDTHNLIMSDTIKEILADTPMTFSEMNYILKEDRVDIFSVLTKNLQFKNLNADVLRYFSPKILQYVIDSFKNVAKNDDNDKVRIRIKITPNDLVKRSPDEIVAALSSLGMGRENCTNIVIDINSITADNDFEECAYVSMYWNYVEMIKRTPQVVDTIVTLLTTSVPGININTYFSHLDLVILKTAIDNIYNKRYHLQEMIETAVKTASEINDFFRPGLDYDEIIKELTRYSVSDLSCIEELSEMQRYKDEKFEYDNHS